MEATEASTSDDGWWVIIVCVVGAVLLIGGYAVWAFGSLSITADAERAVRDRMTDPNSTQFRNVEICDGDQKVVKGDYNSKNLMGGYVGFQPFFYSEYQVATAGDGDFMGMMNRCYGDLKIKINPSDPVEVKAADAAAAASAAAAEAEAALKR